MMRRCMLSSSFFPFPPPPSSSSPPESHLRDISLSISYGKLDQTNSVLPECHLLLRRARSSPPPPTPQIKISFRPDALPTVRPVYAHTQVSAAERINLGAQFFEGNEEGGSFFRPPSFLLLPFPPLLACCTHFPPFLPRRPRQRGLERRKRKREEKRKSSLLSPSLSIKGAFFAFSTVVVASARR